MIPVTYGRTLPQKDHPSSRLLQLLHTRLSWSSCPGSTCVYYLVVSYILILQVLGQSMQFWDWKKDAKVVGRDTLQFEVPPVMHIGSGTTTTGSQSASIMQTALGRFTINCVHKSSVNISCGHHWTILPYISLYLMIVVGRIDNVSSSADIDSHGRSSCFHCMRLWCVLFHIRS